MKKHYFLILLAILIVGGSFMTLGLLRKPYDVLAGRMEISSSKFSISPCKVLVYKLGFNKPEVIPLTITNETDEVLFLEVTYRPPDFVAEGYQPHTMDCGIVITSDYPDLMSVMVLPKSSVAVNIVVNKDANVELPKYEAWLNVGEKNPEMITTGLCMRLLFDN